NSPFYFHLSEVELNFSIEQNSAAPGRKNRTSWFRVLSAVMNETNCAPETDKGSLKLPFFFIRGH
ncbi:hypothetical protein, partial [Holdemania massiliensis]